MRLRAGGPQAQPVREPAPRGVLDAARPDAILLVDLAAEDLGDLRDAAQFGAAEPAAVEEEIQHEGIELVSQALHDPQQQGRQPLAPRSCSYSRS